MKPTSSFLIAVVLLMAVGCQSKVKEPKTTQEDSPTSAPIRQVGKGNLNISFMYIDEYPNASQEASEKGKVPFEILARFGPTDDVSGKGTINLVYFVDFKTAGTCTYQGTAEVVVSGEFWRAPDCQLDLTLKFNYSPAILTSGGSSLCGPLEWKSHTIEVKDMDAMIGSRYRIQNYMTDSEIYLTDLELDFDETGCFAGIKVE